MHPRAAALIELLELERHPEGGYFREVFRSPRVVRPADRDAARRAITTIYFLLVAGSHSRWHRVASDEVWHYYEGDPLELLWLDEGGTRCSRQALGPAGDSCRPVQVVPAGCWQAARPTGAYTLVGCTVGPGFEFADFELLGARPAEAAELRERFPDLAALV